MELLGRQFESTFPLCSSIYFYGEKKQETSVQESQFAHRDFPTGTRSKLNTKDGENMQANVGRFQDVVCWTAKMDIVLLQGSTIFAYPLNANNQHFLVLV